jgi:hypothetical protein
VVGAFVFGLEGYLHHPPDAFKHQHGH